MSFYKTSSSLKHKLRFTKTWEISDSIESPGNQNVQEGVRLNYTSFHVHYHYDHYLDVNKSLN